MSGSAGRRRQNIGGLARDVRIVAWLAEQHEPVTTSQLAAGVGLSVSRAREALVHLALEGLVRDLEAPTSQGETSQWVAMVDEHPRAQEVVGG